MVKLESGIPPVQRLARRDPPPPDPPPPDPPPPDPLPQIAQNFALFFPSPATVFILFSLSCWSFSLNFGGVFEDRDPQMCSLGSRVVV